MTATRWLSCHVDYACRHSGACCRSGWPLPVDDRVVPAIAAAVERGHLSTVDGDVIWLQQTAEAPEGVAGTFRQVAEACVFHVAPAAAEVTTTARRHCAVHARLGHAALPATCQHFPRVCLIDDRGVRVSLSHFCPTAAAMLVDDARPVTIVTGPPAVPGVEVPEGLDARGQLPPRLTDRVLMDLESSTAWEAHVVGVLAGPHAVPGAIDDVLASLAADAEALRGWSPADGSLADAVAARARGGVAAPVPAWRLSPAAVYRMGQAASRAPWPWPALPEGLDALDAQLVAPAWADSAAAVRRYLAAKAFGAWIVYQEDATRALVTWLQVALTVLRVECARACASAGHRLDRERLVAAVRSADRLLVHHADGAALAAAIAGRERD